MIHRSAIGSLERIFAFLIEHYAGAFPLWLSPTHIAIVPVNEAHQEYAVKIKNSLREAGIRVEIDTTNETLGKKIRKAKVEKIPYIAVIGDKEIESNEITLESRDTKESTKVSFENLLKKLTQEIKEKK